MIINNLYIRNLRNHAESHLNFGSGLNVLYGNNGAGKTTILEAISIASLSKSFLPASDASLIKNGENSFAIHAEAKNDIGIDHEITIRYEFGSKKKISTNTDDNLLPKDIIGIIPIVILSPDYKAITFGSPQDRRSFIDSILCQSSKVYMDDLFKLRKCLKQRNNLLSIAKKDRFFDYSEIEPWTEMLINLNVKIGLRRSIFIRNFSPYFLASYQTIAGSSDVVTLSYEPHGLDSDVFYEKESSIEERIRGIAVKLKQNEIYRGSSLFGPQRDDLKISINGGLARDYASQGQHKSILISLKLAEYEFLKDICHENPIILLDDIFSELDDERSNKVLELVEKNRSQIFITLTNPDRIRQFISTKQNCTLTQITNVDGKIIVD